MTQEEYKHLLIIVKTGCELKYCNYCPFLNEGVCSLLNEIRGECWSVTSDVMRQIAKDKIKLILSSIMEGSDEKV